MNATTYGLDIAKSVFQLYWVNPQSGEIFNRRFSRDQLIRFLSQREPGRVVLEACGGAHWWARKIISLGHQAVLLHPKYVRPFVQTNKTDAADARAIWTTAQQPGMRTVAIKTEAQQAILSLHRIRSALVDTRTRLVNQIRGLLGEYGLGFRYGRKAFMNELSVRMPEIEQAVPALIWRALQHQLAHLRQLEADITETERENLHWMKANPAAQMLAAINGIGPLTATATVAVMGSPNTFRSGRAFAASLGLVPAQTGTGGKVRLGGITKRGDPYLRKLLIHGARIVVTRSKQRPAWVDALLSRRPVNVAIVALANKMARIAWALLAHGQVYDPKHVSTRPLA
ncbi:transposase [Burkholderia lata]|uniref:IS110 family transposase n=1 Tax=Burkholderia lata (strain ATCC 17760 / DSM 23089 / LMG 22485 / NCIMB 9086 / R18194 / 383) TaxID=482957 RepID=UPI0014531C8A|nr:IS110 family transposase [Burkholderia lata]VWC78529.1 transposase [Burkholderia lata]